MLEAQKIDPAAMLLSQQLPAAGAQVPGGPAVASGADGQPAVLPYRSETVKDPSTDSHSSTTTVKETPAMAGATSDLGGAYDAKIAAQKAQTEANVQMEGIGAQGADEEARIRQETMKRQQEAQQAWEKRIAGIMAEREQARKDRDALKPKTYDEDMGFGRRILTALSLGAGTYGAIRGGGPNTALEIYKSNVAEFEKKQNALIEANANRVLEKTGDINAARDQMAKDKANLLDEQILKIDTLKARTQAQMKRVPQAATAGAALVAELDKEKAEKKLAQANLLAPRVEGGSTTHGTERSVNTVEGIKPGSGISNAKPTQFEQTLALHGDTMQKSIDLLRSLKPIGTEALSKAQDNESALDAAAEENKSLSGAAKVIAGRRLGLLPRNKGEGLSENDQLYLNAVDAANEGFQRVLSGANIQEKERSRLSNQLAIQPNDPPKVVQWKLDKMEREKENFLKLAGKAGEELRAKPAQSPIAPPPFRPAQAAASPPRMDSATRDRLGEAYKVKRGDPDYAEAQSFIRAATAKYGGK